MAQLAEPSAQIAHAGRVRIRCFGAGFHIGAGGVDIGAVWPGINPKHYLATLSATFFLNNCRTISNLIFSGLLDRFPDRSDRACGCGGARRL